MRQAWSFSNVRGWIQGVKVGLTTLSRQEFGFCWSCVLYYEGISVWCRREWPYLSSFMGLSLDLILAEVLVLDPWTWFWVVPRQGPELWLLLGVCRIGTETHTGPTFGLLWEGAIQSNPFFLSLFPQRFHRGFMLLTFFPSAVGTSGLWGLHVCVWQGLKEGCGKHGLSYRSLLESSLCKVCFVLLLAQSIRNKCGFAFLQFQ